MIKCDNGLELFPIVDECGKTIGKAMRSECHNGSKILHPVVHLHVFDSSGRLYLQHRPKWKDIQPDKWDTAVGGHVEYGETVLEALMRESFEELSLREFNPLFITHYVYESEIEREFVNVFKTVTKIEPQPSDELEEGRFFRIEEIEQKLNTNFFTTNFEWEWKIIKPYL